MKFFQIHAENPQPRLVRQAVDVIRKGGVIIYPADNSYAMGCGVGEKAALDRIRMIRRLDDKHNFTLLCRDLSELGLYAKVGTSAFRLLKAHLPGPYTFILDATREVPRMLMHPKKRTIGLRVPANPIAQALLEELGEPLMSVSLIMPGATEPLSDPYEIRDLLENQVDLIIDGGYGTYEATTVVSLVDDTPEVIRFGSGDASAFVGA
ncbi:MAG: threonylcarbamoyl-AMP synthase [Gammaproteobacteria bacterium]|nr:threonylcarbamoyl-AMP synthase [Gammaproteobacteria bacterium]